MRARSLTLPPTLLRRYGEQVCMRTYAKATVTTKREERKKATKANKLTTTEIKTKTQLQKRAAKIREIKNKKNEIKSQKIKRWLLSFICPRAAAMTLHRHRVAVTAVRAAAALLRRHHNRPTPPHRLHKRPCRVRYRRIL